MDEKKIDNGRTIGSVKAAINKYGGKFNQSTNFVKIPNKSASDPQKIPSKAQELHLAKNRINQINEDRKTAESVKSQAELELLEAKKTVRELTSQIEESKSKAKELQNLKKAKMIGKQQTLDDNQYAEVEREVAVLKQEHSEIRLNMGCVLEEKSQAEAEAEAAKLKLESCMSSAEQLRREIEEANEEEVLVELAQIQARKELAAIEAQRKEEAERVSSLIEETRKKIGVLTEEIEQMKDLEEKLAGTNSDVEVLQNELNLIKEMDRRVESGANMEDSELQSVTKDLEAAKEELESIKGGVFHLMSGMDTVRNELMDILKEKDRIEKSEEKAEKKLETLNSKLLRVKDKLEAVSASEEKAKLMLPSLSLALEELERERDAAKREREDMTAETAGIRAEIPKIESETNLTDERLDVAIEQLSVIKSAEAKALKKLKALVESAVKARASQKKPIITISRFEHDYLTGNAIGAQEMADKKVAAANAWTEALRTSEREMRMKIALAERTIKELRLKEDQEIYELDKLLNERESDEPRKSVRESSYSLTPVRQGKFRRSVGAPARRLTGSGSFTIKRRMITLRIANYFANKHIENER